MISSNISLPRYTGIATDHSMGEVERKYMPPSTAEVRAKRVSEFQRHIELCLSSPGKISIGTDFVKSIGQADVQCWLMDQHANMDSPLDVWTAISFLACYGDVHLFKLYAARFPGLTAFALVSTAPPFEGEDEIVHYLAETALELGSELGFAVENEAELGGVCSGALCHVLLRAPVTADLCADHPVLDALKRQVPRVSRHLLADISPLAMDNEGKVVDLRSEMARLIRPY